METNNVKQKVFNIAVIGCKIGEPHIKAIVQNPNANLYGVCDLNEELLARIVKENNPETYTTNWKDYLDDPKVEAVIVGTPDKLHLEMTAAFLRAGKDVMCEKPMALTVEECEEMMRVEKETGRRLMVGQVGRFCPAFKRAKKMIDEGMIGDLFFVESEYAHDYSHARGAGDWRVDPDRHAVIGGGCHAIDLLRWIAGDPTDVFALSNRKCLTDWPVDDCCIAVMKFPNGVNGKVLTSIGCKRDYTMRTVLYGTKGTIICDNTSNFLTYFAGEENHPAFLPIEKKSFTVPQKLSVSIAHHNMVGELKMFLDSLMSGEPFPISPMEGASTVAVCRAVVKSCATGQMEKVEYPNKI